jgi:hypothetical protein
MWDGSRERPNAHARLLLQLDDLSGHTTAAAVIRNKSIRRRGVSRFPVHRWSDRRNWFRLRRRLVAV